VPRLRKEKFTGGGKMHGFLGANSSHYAERTRDSICAIRFCALRPDRPHFADESHAAPTAGNALVVQPRHLLLPIRRMTIT